MYGLRLASASDLTQIAILKEQASACSFALMNDGTSKTMTRTTMIAATLAVLLAGCGTASGLAEGTGRVFEGIGEDFRSLGGAVRR